MRLGEAAQARYLTEPRKRWAVMGLIRDRFRWRRLGDGLFRPAGYAPPYSEADIFEHSYGNTGGADYWDAWLSWPETAATWATLLATHVAWDEDSFARCHRALLQLLTAPGVSIALRDVVAQLLASPDTRRVVPESLRRHLAPDVAIPTAPIEPSAAVATGEVNQGPQRGATPASSAGEGGSAEITAQTPLPKPSATKRRRMSTQKRNAALDWLVRETTERKRKGEQESNVTAESRQLLAAAPARLQGIYTLRGLRSNRRFLKAFKVLKQ
jgi:hypothetical protein